MTPSKKKRKKHRHKFVFDLWGFKRSGKEKDIELYCKCGELKP